MKKYLLLVGLSVVAANALVIPKLVDAGISTIDLPTDSIGTSHGGTISDTQAQTDGIGIIISTPTTVSHIVDNSSYNTLINKYGTLLSIGQSLQDYLSTNYSTLNIADQRLVDEVIANTSSNATNGDPLVNLVGATIPSPPTVPSLLHPNGTVCDDGNINTKGDKYFNDICTGHIDWSSCDDGDINTINDSYFNGICGGNLSYYNSAGPINNCSLFAPYYTSTYFLSSMIKNGVTMYVCEAHHTNSVGVTGTSYRHSASCNSGYNSFITYYDLTASLAVYRVCAQCPNGTSFVEHGMVTECRVNN